MMDKILNNLGLCQRARGLVAGEDMTIDYLQKKMVYYIFLAKDAGPNTTKKILDKAKYYGVEVNNDYTALELSHAIGKENRVVISIINQGFLKILKK